MAPISTGIKKVTLRGRVGRDSRRSGGGDRYEVRAYNGQEGVTKYVGRFFTLSEAKDAKTRYEKKHRRRGTGRARRMTWSELIDQYLARKRTTGKKPRPIKESTTRANQYAVKAFAEEFGAWPVRKVTEEHLIAWADGVADGTVEGVRAMFSWALETRSIDENPMLWVPSRRSGGRSFESKNLICDSELQRALEAAEASRPGLMGLRLRVLLALLAFAGMRPSEAFALRPQHLDMEHSTIYLEWQLDERGELQALKNRRKRLISMDPRVRCEIERLLLEVSGDELLFTTVTGRKFNVKGKWHYYWDPIRRQIPGRQDMHVYELRHYCATALLNNGVSPADVALHLGHSDGGTLVIKIYGHPDVDLARGRVLRVMEGMTVGVPRPEHLRPTQERPEVAA